MKAMVGKDAGFERISRGLAMLAVATYLLVSPALLTVLGVPYDAPYGSFVYKFHPGSYLLMLALACSLAGQGNPLVALARRLHANPLLVCYLAAMMLSFAWSIVRHGASGSAFFIDTLIMPAVAALTLMQVDAAGLRRLMRWMLALVVLNALIGLVEVALHTHLVPYTVAGGVPVIEDKFRATALLGHPLQNALVTSMMLLASLDMPMRPWRRGVLCGVLVLGLLAFGGRTSFLLTALALLAYAGWSAWQGLRTGRYGYLHVLGSAILIIFALPVAMLLIWISGLGERIFEGLYLDDSASVRWRIFGVFSYLDTADLLFGMAPASIQEIAVRVGLSDTLEAIENFWLYMLLQLGVFGFATFVVGLLAGLGELWRRAGSGGRWTLVVFLITASTTNSLASKTSVLTLLFALLWAVSGYRRWQRTPLPRPQMAKPARSPGFSNLHSGGVA